MAARPMKAKDGDRMVIWRLGFTPLSDFNQLIRRFADSPIRLIGIASSDNDSLCTAAMSKGIIHTETWSAAPLSAHGDQ